MRTLAVVQARTGSTRLPGKVLAEVGGRPLLRFMLDRLGRLDVDDLAVATSTEPGDDAVATVAADAGVTVVRGPEDDVLARFALALTRHPADTVVRLTADCPLVDPALVEDAVRVHERAGADYTSNSLIRTFPDGLDVEVLAADALRQAAAEAVDPLEREHVTPFVYRRTSRYRIAAFWTDADLGAERWTVDTAADLERVRAIVAGLADPVAAGWRDILAVAGRQVVPARGRLRLRPVPHEDASTRTWKALRDGAEVAQATVEVTDGEGSLTYTGPDAERPEIVALVGRALTADHQVVRLRAESSR